MTEKRKIFVLDTNVLIHDPTSILRFHEHDVVIPIVVLEELDRVKVGMSEVARNVRQVSRLIDGGVEKLDGDFWDKHSKEMESWKEEGRTFYRLKGPRARSWFPSQFLQTTDEKNPFEAIVRRIEGDSAIIEVVRDYKSERHKVWGI